MSDLYLTPAEKYTAALGGFYYGDLPEPGTVYTQLIKDILDGSTLDKVPKNILARFIYSLYISDLGDPYPRYELAKLLYWKLHNITPTKSGSILTVTIDGKEDYMTINTDLSRLWYKVLFGSKTDVITEFPYIFNTMQNKLSDWELFGNVSVSGTPTPDNPVMPQGTGERTGNLFNIVSSEVGLLDSSGDVTSNVSYSTSDYIVITESFSLSLTAVFALSIRLLRVGYYDVNKGNISVESTTGFKDGHKEFTFTPPNGTMYIRFSYISREGYKDTNIMLNTGSTAKPYEPYGYKIPISSADTTTPVYLGEVQTTRKIKKLVLNGTEGWNRIDNCFRLLVSGILPENEIMCSHFAKKSGYILRNGGSGIANYGNFYSDFYRGFYIRNDELAPDTATFKTYLAAQYAAGTPVTVWYVLATETTGIVNEPIRKIGDYADSMSRAQTGIDIPTVIGQNTLDVLTTVKPSSMSIEYTSADENRSRSRRISLLKSPLKKGLIK